MKNIANERNWKIYYLYKKHKKCCLSHIDCLANYFRWRSKTKRSKNSNILELISSSPSFTLPCLTCAPDLSFRHQLIVWCVSALVHIYGVYCGCVFWCLRFSRCPWLLEELAYFICVCVVCFGDWSTIDLLMIYFISYRCWWVLLAESKSVEKL